MLLVPLLERDLAVIIIDRDVSFVLCYFYLLCDRKLIVQLRSQTGKKSMHFTDEVCSDCSVIETGLCLPCISMTMSTDSILLDHQIDNDGETRVAVPHPDVPRGTVFRFDPSDERTMSSAPSLGDPHERASCFVATSTLPGGGAGM